MVIMEEPILTRLDRLDNMMKHLEESRGCSNNNKVSSSPKSSCASTLSSGVLTSDHDHGHASSSLDFSPKSLEKHCRPIDNVIMETEVKGTLIERLRQIENRVLKLEEELEAEIRRGEHGSEEKIKLHKNGGWKKLVKVLVKRRGNQKPEDR